MKKILLILSILFYFYLTVASDDKTKKLIESASKEHPRLFLNNEVVKNLPKKISSDKTFQRSFDQIKQLSDELLKLEPLKFEVKGNRLLDVSRNAIKRICHLSFTYLVTKEIRYAKKATEEMLAIAKFKSWNPGHFLDTAEMTTAMAIGYDWLYDTFDEPTKNKIKTAILTLGLLPAKQNHGWVYNNNNWNQVCHGGICVGAMAIMEDAPELADYLISRAVKYIPNSMKEYAPDGAFPEGPGYWEYGTSYNVLFIAALESVLGTDFNLSDKKGFMESAYYMNHVITPSGKLYNYSDNWKNKKPSTSMYWFANKSKDTSTLYQEKLSLEEYLNSKTRLDNTMDRFFPFLLIWANSLDNIKPLSKNSWHGDGQTPVAFHRSGWESKEEIFFGMKGGTPFTNHSHMDIGSFIIEANGQRWAEDFQPQSYRDLESKGVGLWDLKQNSQRWDLLRYSNTGHSTLVVNDQKQNVNGGICNFIKHKNDGTNSFSILNISNAYKGQLNSAKRGIALHKSTIIIQDEVFALDKETSIRWGLLTKAEITFQSNNEAVLILEDKKIQISLETSQDIKFEIFDMEKPPNKFEKPNPGYKMLGFHINLPKNTKEEYRVIVETNLKSVSVPKFQTLSEW